MKYQIRFNSAQSLATFIAEFISITRLQFDVEENVDGKFIMNIYR